MTTTTQAVVATMRCTRCGQHRMWCSCRTEPAKFYTRRGPLWTHLLIFCSHGETAGRYPTACGLTQKEMVQETARMSPEPYCACIMALLQEEQED